MAYDAQGSPQGRGRPGPTEISKSAWSHSAPGAQLCARDSAGGASTINKHLGPSWGGGTLERMSHNRDSVWAEWRSREDPWDGGRTSGRWPGMLVTSAKGHTRGGGAGSSPLPRSGKQRGRRNEPEFSTGGGTVGSSGFLRWGRAQTL